ncbi:Scr1 family TA system antitoxin-like transcriptional regulator [Streptomyces decoyicus]|uniref:Scr1 family TA system antitoxin-like transcriptional regulator n=1 Tax=Streptomyces decoyicus TaxID=249567 RepID=UPI0038636475
MGRRSRNPVNTPGPLGEFASDLQALRQAAGLTAAQTHEYTKVPLSTIYAALSGNRLPSPSVLSALIGAWGGSRQEWHERRHEVEAQLATDVALPTGESPSRGSCVRCGKPLSAAARGRNRIYCGPDCRRAAARARHRNNPPEAQARGGASTSALTFASRIGEIHKRAGGPPLRELSRRTGVSASTLSRALSGEKIPSWRVVEMIMSAFAVDDDDREALRGAWVQAACSLDRRQSTTLRSGNATPVITAAAPADFHPKTMNSRKLPAAYEANRGAIEGKAPLFTAQEDETDRAAREREVNPVAASIILGATLRDLRTKSGMTMLDAARALRCSASRVSRIEGAQSAPNLRDIRAFMQIYGVADEDADTLEALATRALAPAWWRSFGEAVPAWITRLVALESTAASVWTYQLATVPALLQTAEYASALQDMAELAPQAGKASHRLAFQAARQERYFRSSVQSIFILDEGVLHRTFGSALVMAEQMERLIQVAGSPGQEIRILSYGAGIPPLPFPVVHLLFDGEIPDATFAGEGDGFRYVSDSGSHWGTSDFRNALIRMTERSESSEASLEMIRGARDRFTAELK